MTTVRFASLVERMDLKAGKTGASLPLLSVSQTLGVLRFSDLHDRPPRADSFDVYKVVEPGDIAFNKMSIRSGAVGVVPERGIVTYHYEVMRPRAGVDARFVVALMKSSWFIGELIRNERGIGAGGAAGVRTTEVPFSVMRTIGVPHFSGEEQQQIADYLDRETAEIDAFIADQEHFHKLLLEHQEATRSNVIRRAAEQHRTPHVRLKFLANVTVGIVVNPSSWYVEEEGVPALRGLNVRPEEISTSELVHISREGHAVHSKSRLEAGDLVVVRTGQAGAAAVIPQDLHDCNAIDLLIVKPGPTVASEFLAMYINSDVARGVIAAQSVGAIQAHFNVEALRNLPIPLLDVSQQLHLVGVWQKESRAVELSLRDVEISIHLAKERRSALISAAVTGKIDVTTQGAPTAEQLRDELEVHV